MSIDADSKLKLIDDLNFIRDECDRLKPKAGEEISAFVERLQKNRDFVCLDASGGEFICCGREGFVRVRQISRMIARTSDVSESIDGTRVERVLAQQLVKKVIKQRLGITTELLEEIIGQVLSAAKSELRDITYFIPCRLMYESGDGIFDIGPVTFKAHDVFKSDIQPHLEKYLNEDKAETRKKLSEKFAKHAELYFSDFSWVAVVKIVRCAPVIAKERAHLAIRTAISFIQLLFGSYHTRRMNVGGARLGRNEQAIMYLNEYGRLEIETSSSATSAVGFQSDWRSLLEDPKVRPLINGAAKAIAALIDPNIKSLPSLRMADSLSWFGQAVAEPSHAAKIIKSISAIECLVLTGELYKIKETLTKRAVALYLGHYDDKTYFEVKATFLRMYGLRSDLVHGSKSPFDNEVMEFADECIIFCEKVLKAGLYFFETEKLMDSECNLDEMKERYRRLIMAVATTLRVKRKASSRRT